MRLRHFLTVVIPVTAFCLLCEQTILFAWDWAQTSGALPGLAGVAALSLVGGVLHVRSHQSQKPETPEQRFARFAWEDYERQKDAERRADEFNRNAAAVAGKVG